MVGSVHQVSVFQISSAASQSLAPTSEPVGAQPALFACVVCFGVEEGQYGSWQIDTFFSWMKQLSTQCATGHFSCKVFGFTWMWRIAEDGSDWILTLPPP